MTKLTGMVAIVTGANSRIGKATTKRLAEEGARVILAGRNDEKLQRVAEHLSGGDYLITSTNVVYRDDVDAPVENAIARFGKINILVNRADINLSSKITGHKVGDWDRTISTNIKGLLYSLNTVLPHFEGRSSGHIVDMASISSFEASKTSVLCSATKSTILRIVEALERELARTGIKSTSILSGMVDTPMTEGYDFGDRKKLDPESIADAVIYAVTQSAHVNVNEVVVRPV